jgi:hypothetical protein
MAQKTEEYTPDEAAFAKARRSAIDQALLQAHHEARGDAEQKGVLQNSQYSQYYQLLREMAEAAQAFAITKQQTVDRFDFGILQDAMRVCESVHSAFHTAYVSMETIEKVPELRAVKSRELPDLVWSHLDKLDRRVRIDDMLVAYFDKDTLLWSVGQYLNLPIRSQIMDRILVDSMVAALILARRNPAMPEFVDINEWMVKGIKLIQKGIFSMVRNALVFGGIAAAAFYLASMDAYSYSQPSWVRNLSTWFSPETWRWIGWACGILMVLRLATTVVRWRKKLSEVADGERSTRDLSAAISNTYDELASPGPVSAARVRELATKAAEKGAKWPPPLFALLDDIQARSSHIGPVPSSFV